MLGVPVGPYLERADDEALHAFREQRELTAARPATSVHEVPVMADFEQIVEQLFTMNRYEVARAHADWFARFGDRYREETAARPSGRATRSGTPPTRRPGCGAPPSANGSRRTGSDAGIDVWIAPSATGPAPAGLTSTGSSMMCLPWSNAGLPSVSLPAGRRRAGCRSGLQLVGPVRRGRRAAAGGGRHRACTEREFGRGSDAGAGLPEAGPGTRGRPYRGAERKGAEGGCVSETRRRPPG